MSPWTLLFIALTSALFLTPPAMAQQGPAGVPGAPLLGAEIAPPPPEPEKPAPLRAEPQPEPEKPRIIAQCRKAKNIERCEERHARRIARQEARKACKNQSPKKRQRCINEHLAKSAK